MFGSMNVKKKNSNVAPKIHTYFEKNTILILFLNDKILKSVCFFLERQDI